MTLDDAMHAAKRRGPALAGGRAGGALVSRATVLFVDIRGYTGVAETMMLGRLALWLGEYLHDMTLVVERFGGTVEHLLGDGLMAVFSGDPRATSKDAVDCALAMDTALHELNRRFAERGLPAIRMRIGIDTGQIVRTTVVTAGESRSMLLGDTINVASRLQSLELDETSADDEPTRITLSQETRQHAGPAYRARLIGEIALRGKSKPVTAWQIVPERRQELAA